LVCFGLPHEDLGVLDQGGGVAEDEVDCARDFTVAVELTVGVCVQCVLVTAHCAIEED